MPVARCCAAVPKQRDALMLSCTLGFPHAERRPHAVIQAGLSIQRDVLMLSCKLGFTHAERRPYAVIQARLQS